MVCSASSQRSTGRAALWAHPGERHTQLADAALGDDPASLWVLEDNPRARAFYRRHGFDPDGAVKTHTVDGAAIREVRLVRGGTLA